MSGKHTILLFRFGAIGNALVAVPAIRAIRKGMPDARLVLVGDPLTLDLLEGCPYIDETVRYDSKGPERAGPGYLRFIGKLRSFRPTHAVHFKRYLRSELMGFLSGAPVRVGFETDERIQLINRKVVYEEGESVIEQNLKLARALGIDADGRALEIWPHRESEKVDSIVSSLSGAGPLVVIHPAGATQKESLWPHFAELGMLLRKNLDARVVMTGSGGERGLVEESAQKMDPPAAVAVGLPIREAAELIRRADLFCGTDSGPAHIADAAGTPGAIIYAPHKGMTDQLEKWKPEGEGYVAFTPETDCDDCGEYPCPSEKRAECASDIDPAEVAKALKLLYHGGQ